MCPACIAGTAWLVAGATSAGGLGAFLAAKLVKHRRERNPPTSSGDAAVHDEPARRRSDSPTSKT